MIIMNLVKQVAKRIVYKFPSTFVLMFHHVTSEPAVKRSGCVLSTESFARIIELLDGFRSLDETVAKKNKRGIVITFDDGLEDVYTVVYPYLTQKNIPFTIFVITENIGLPGYISEQQLIEMSRNPLVSIGAHGTSHEILRGMNSAQQEYELRESKTWVESRIGKNCTSFAYSHGAYDDTTLNLVRQYYRYAMSVIEHPINTIMARNNYLLPRFNIDENTFEEQLKILKKYYLR